MHDLIRLQGICKTYRTKEEKLYVLDNIDIRIKDGEFISITGQSGSGKSTLLHLLGGVDRPTSGRVIIDGEDIFKHSDDEIAIFRRREIGIIYQFYNLIPSLNVVDNITLPLRLDHQKVNEDHLAQILKMLKLTRVKDHLPNQLSGGQQQRVAIGRALIANPAIILADEPTGNLDSNNSKEVVGLLEKASKDFQKTVVLITHDMKIAAEADRVITFEDGKIVKDKRSK